MSVNTGMMIEWRIHKTLQSSLTDVETVKVRSKHIEKLYKRQLFSGLPFSSLIFKSHLKMVECKTNFWFAFSIFILQN